MATRGKVALLTSNPCLEGLLLELFDDSVPYTCAECKEKLKRKFRLRDNSPDTYKALFEFQLTKELIEQKRHEISTLERICTLMKGNKIDLV